MEGREDTRVSWESPEVVEGGEDVVGKGLSVGTSVGVVEGPVARRPRSSTMQVEVGSTDIVSKLDGSFVVFSEVIPSWLLVVKDRVNTDSMWVYIENEAPFFRRATGLRDIRCAVTPFWDEMVQWPWGKQDLPAVYLVQGSAKFCTKVLSVVKPRVRPVDKILAVSAGSRINHRFGIQGFKWTTLHHSKFGGVTLGKHKLGCTSNLRNNATDTSLLVESKCERNLIDLLKVDVSGKPCPAPSEDPSDSKDGIDPRVLVAPQELLEPMPVPSVFSRVTGWVRRRLKPQEIGAAVDLPVTVLEPLSVVASMSAAFLSLLVMLPPLKIIQAVFQLLVPVDRPSSSGAKKDVILPQSSETFSLSISVPSESAAEISKANAKAVKSDDAKTDEDFWNLNAVTPPDGDSTNWLMLTGEYDETSHGVIFNFLRVRMARQFARNVTSSARTYLHQNYSEEQRAVKDSPDGSLREDLAGMKDAIHRVRGSSFWDWDRGSFPFFWRWQPEVKKDMRDGTPLFVKGPMPNFRRAQRLPKDKSVAERIKDKVNKVRRRAYVACGKVLSLTSYFHVPKGESDIRMVYDLTACGLNAALWAPTFWMPTLLNVLDCACHSSWFGDVDAGEMFLNYPLDVFIRPYAGVDVSWSQPGWDDGGGEPYWERWTRMAMGLLSSPWVTTRLFAWAMEIIKGDRRDPSNPFHWTHVVLNCPGMPAYDPTMPRLYKWNPVSKSIAGDCKTFVDDLRSIGPTKALCRALTHRVETMMGYLGLQDATRKRRPDSQTPGEWTGSIVRAIEGVGLFVTVSPAKWAKAKGIIDSLINCFESPEDLPQLDLKDMERKVGFLVHLAMAYPLMLPFLKGFYLTMNSWRPQRDSNGWKMSGRAYEAFMSEARRSGESWSHRGHFKNDKEAPASVKASPLLYDHLKALQSLFEGEEPTLRLIRGVSLLEVLYIFGDASGGGFGSSWTAPDWTSLHFRIGVWAEEGDGTSSNYREFRNLTETLEEIGAQGKLEGREIFLFTDNSVSESIASKGSSKSELLYDLVVRIYKLQMRCRCVVHFVHVAGTRMIEQGTDGLSRGDMLEGVMKGEPILSYVSLHKTAVEVSPAVFEWISNHWGSQFGKPVELLSMEDWFERGHDFDGSRVNCDGVWMPNYRSGVFVWAPPPGVARFAIEELRQARQKRQASAHIFVCPKLLYEEWRRHFYKVVDLQIRVPAGVCDFWPASVRGNSKVRPSWWDWKGTCYACSKPVLPMDGIFCQNFAYSRGSWTACRFSSCAECYRDNPDFQFPVSRAFNDESEYYKRRREDALKYLVARKGDWVIAPFQCDHCWFINLFGRRPLVCTQTDKWNLGMIRRANLDIFWSRESSTVNGVRGRIKELIRRARESGRSIPLEEMEPWEVGDKQGMGLAIAMLEKSLQPGKNSEKYTQFDTCRQLRAAASDVYGGTSKASALRYNLKQRNHVLHLEQSPTQTILLERMTAGMSARMPKESSRNLPIVSSMVLYILNALEEELFRPSTDDDRKRLIMMTGAYICIAFGYSLRGNEGFWVDAEGLCTHIDVGKMDARIPHVIVPLLGRFKSEMGDRMHVIPIASVTRSGIRIRAWVERLVRVLKAEGKTNCPAFCDDEGYQLTASTLERVYLPILEQMQRDPDYPDVVPRGIDVRSYYLLARGLRRGAESEAINQDVDKSVIDFVNRWNQYERNRGKQPKVFDMMQHYADGSKTRYKALKFSSSL